MTKEQYQWLKDNGYDPAVYDIDESGNVIQSPLAAAAPKPEVMSAPRAFGTSFLGSVIPSGAGLAGGAGAGALAGTLGAGPVGTVLGAIAGGLGAGYGAGKLQQKALEEFAPGALEELARAERDQPVASYLGGFAPNVIAMKPSFKGISGLTAPLQSFEKPIAQRAFLPAAVNVGANVASSTAGQLVNMAEGGEFSAPRFAADVALGSLFSDPNRIGRKMGFKPLDLETPPVQRMDVGEARLAREQAAAQAADEAARVSDAEASARATELLGGAAEPTVKPTGEVDVRTANIERNRQNIARELERMSKQAPPEDLVQDLANDPFIPGEDPAALNDWLADKADKYLAKAFAEREAAMKASPEYLGQEMAAGRERAAAFTPEGGSRVAPETWMPESATPPPTTAEGVAAEQLLAEAKQRNDPQAIVQARQLADEIYSRLQRGGEEGQITQAQIDEAAQIAAKRGLKLEFADLKGGRGSFTLNTPDGTPLIRIDPMSATPDTAIHEIGHDVYARSPNERMRASLNDAAMGSEAYRIELAARQAQVDAKKITPEQAHLLALEEGVVQAFGEKYPNVPRGEIKAWFNSLKASIKSMMGMKLSPEDSARWLYYATHEAVPWKGAVAVKTGQQPGEESVRLQRGISEIERLRRRGGIHSTVADNFDAAFNTRRFKEGEANSLLKEIPRLNEAQREQLGRLLGQEFDQKRFINPPAELKAAYDEYRNVIQPYWVNEYNNQGMMIRSASGLRGRQADPFYAPFHRLSDEAKRILTTQQSSPEYAKLYNDYIKQHTDYHLGLGKNLQDAQTAAKADFAEEIAMRSAPYDSSKSGTFAGSRKAMGLPLPESWRSYDVLENLHNYNRRSATDYAHQLHLEKSPETMAALGSKTMFNDAPIPANVLATTPNLAADPSIQALNKNFAGAPMRSSDSASAGLTRLVGASTIGTVSKAVEIPGTMISGLRYLQAGDYAEGMMSFLGKLASFADTQRRSYESGLNRRDGAMAMREVFGMADDASGFMNRAAEVLSKYTGLNALESAARTISQAWGETVVALNKRRALGGDAEAVRFLDTLSKDWRTRSDADLSAQVGRLLQGSYDLTQLPREFLESGAAPYLTWSKWSAGQLNSFMRFAVDPLMQGNAKPLIAHLLIGLLGGAAVGQVREWLNNREGRDINWKELEAWAQQNQGLGAEGYKQLGTKLMNIMQGVGTFGIAGDIVKMTLNAASGGTRQGLATAPAADAVFSTAERAAAALKALDDGEDFGRVLQALVVDTAKTHFQVARVAQNWLDEDENLAYDDRRRKRLFDELTGQSRPGVFTTSYSNLSERDFEKEVNPARMAERAQELVKRAAEKSGSDYEMYQRELQKLKTQQNTIIPSLERQPQRAARYLSWLEGAEEGRGADAYKRSLRKAAEIKYRKALVEGFGGVR